MGYIYTPVFILQVYNTGQTFELERKTTDEDLYILQEYCAVKRQSNQDLTLLTIMIHQYDNFILK